MKQSKICGFRLSVLHIYLYLLIIIYYITFSATIGDQKNVMEKKISSKEDYDKLHINKIPSKLGKCYYYY